MTLFRHQGGDVSDAETIRRNPEPDARGFAAGAKRFRWNFHAVVNHLDLFGRKTTGDHGFRHEPGHGDDPRRRAVPRAGSGTRSKRERDASRDNQGSRAIGSREPRGAQCVGFVGMNHIHLAAAHQSPDIPRRGKPPEARSNFVHRYAGTFCAARQLGIAERDQRGSMPAPGEALQQQQRLVLPAAKIPAEVDDERAHAQASPGLGQERRVSVSPARRRPSLRYLR